jgi:YggT family protein
LEKGDKMGLISILIKFYIIILMLRGVMTRQELYFNPAGKFVAAATEPIFSTLFKKLTKASTDKLIPILIIFLTVIYALLMALFYGDLISSLIRSISDILGFLMLFYIASVYLGSFVNTYSAGAYTTYFYRIGLFWVKLTRTFIKISGNKIILPTIIVIFLAYVIAHTLLLSAVSIIGGKTDFIFLLKASTKTGLMEFVGVFRIIAWLIIIRALMSWVSPDPRNPIVQILITITDPFIEPVRKVIPPFGMIDFSPVIALLLIEFCRIFLIRLINLIFA